MLDLEPPVSLALPGPISTNNLFRNVPGKGRVVSAEYASWRKTTRDAIHANQPPRFTLPVTISLFVGEKGVGQMDSDNTAKAYLDALVKAKVIPDDSRKWVRGIAVHWVPGMAGAVAEIRVASRQPAASDVVAKVAKGLRELLR
ncbi:RusA family crossover junction endodeoxyribonuclease [Cereibacter sphaeroides]|nr:RusA family crossover junction endodeoxyribonuclease [Cereibacter sphaeroides]